MHHEHLNKLHLLKESRNSTGCKSSVENYLNWLFTKTLTYEKDTAAWDKVVNGATVRTGEDYLQQVAQKHANMHAEATDTLNRTKYALTHDIQNSERKLNSLRSDIAKAKSELGSIQDQVDLANGGFHEYTNPAEASVRFKSRLDALKLEIKEMQRNKTAIIATTGFTYNNSAAEGKKFTKDFSTLMLTAYNQEVENVIVRLEKTRDLAAALGRVEKAADRVEKLGTMLSTRIHPQYHNLRLEEIKIAFEFKEAEVQRKEREQEERELLREEEKARKEAERIIREAEQEERNKKAELARLLSYQQQHYTNVAGALPVEDPRIAQLQAQIAELENAKEKANSALLNTKAGYVYIISNIGAFGEGIVKIGLTRRLVPADRVKELSSASVPFIFDTHAIHFSQNAVELERKLHQHFNNKRVNKVNERKEFFRVSLNEVKDALVRFSGDGATLQFTEYAEASDYRISVGQTQ